MSPETIGHISGLIVMGSTVPYAIGVFRKKIQPNLASWSVWSIIGLALLLTYRSSGAKENVWPAVFGAINPTLITVLALWRGHRQRPKPWDVVCATGGVSAIVWWCFIRNDASQAQFALYLAISADFCAAIPTFIWVLRTPQADRPFAWTMYAIGYGSSVFAVTDDTVANYALPVYMFVTAFAIVIPLTTYRIRKRLPVTEWI